MTPRERPISQQGVATRAEHARAYLMVAEMVRDDDSLRVGNNIVGSLAVLAGIAAADAICGHALGRRPASDDHFDAIGMLERATPKNSRAQSSLRRLLGSKTDTQYSPELVSTTKAKALLAAARHLVDEMDEVLRK